MPRSFWKSTFVAAILAIAPSFAQAQDSGGEDLELGPKRTALQRLRDKMRRAAASLDKVAIDASLVDLQSEIVGDLDDLLRRSGGGSAASSGAKATPAATDPGDNDGNGKTRPKPPDGAPGEATAADAADTAETIRRLVQQRWGNLPEQARGPLLDVSSEDFPPRYRRMIERYYRRLNAAPVPKAPEPTK